MQRFLGVQTVLGPFTIPEVWMEDICIRIKLEIWRDMRRCYVERSGHKLEGRVRSL